MPSSPSRHVHREPRKPATHGAASTVKGRENAEQRGPGTAPKGTKHPAQLKPDAACRPARTLRGPPTRAAPPQRHGRRRMAAARPAAAAQERRRAPDDTLRRQLPREPYPSTLPPCAHVPSDRHAQPSAKPADGSQLAPPPQPARGAAAPSSLPSPIRCGPDQKHYSGIAPSSERIASGCTKQAQSHLQLYGILTEITHCSRRILQTAQIGHRRRARIHLPVSLFVNNAGILVNAKRPVR
jgi:hypothetical protein